MAHIGQECRPRLGHAQRRHFRRLQLIVGLAQALVAGLEFKGARRNDMLKLPQVLRKAVFGVAPLLDLGFHVFELLVGDADEHADFIVFMPRWAIQARLFACAQLADNAYQRLGEHYVEQAEQNPGEQQAAGEAVEQGDLGAMQETAAKGIGVDVEAQHTERVVGHMAEKQPVFELAIGTKQKVADGPIVAFFARAVDVGQHHAIVVDQLRADDGRGVQQAQGQFLGEFGIDVVGDA